MCLLLLLDIAVRYCCQIFLISEIIFIALNISQLEIRFCRVILYLRLSYYFVFLQTCKLPCLPTSFSTLTSGVGVSYAGTCFMLLVETLRMPEYREMTGLLLNLVSQQHTSCYTLKPEATYYQIARVWTVCPRWTVACPDKNSLDACLF